MNRKKTANLCMSLIMAFNTMLSDITVFAEGEEVPAAEEVTEAADQEELDVLTESPAPDFENAEEENSTAEDTVSEDQSSETEETDQAAEEIQTETFTEMPEVSDETEPVIENETDGSSEVYATPVSDFSYTVLGNEVYIEGYLGNASEVVIPSQIKGYPVTTLFYFGESSSVRSVTIPETMTGFSFESGNILKGCPNLTTIKVDPSNPKFDSRNNSNAVIEKETNTLVLGCKGTVIPDTVTRIGDNAFDGCRTLSAIRIPESVTEIGYAAFEYCTSLKSVVIPDSVVKI